MAETSLQRVPVEIMEEISGYLDVGELIALRSTEQRAYTSLYNVVIERCFMKRTTSLMGKSLANLQGISQHPELRRHVTEICIADSAEEVDPYNCREVIDSSNIWERDPDGMVLPEQLGVVAFRRMLLEKELRPRILTIRNYSIRCKNIKHLTENVRQRHNPQATPGRANKVEWKLAGDIVDQADLAIISILARPSWLQPDWQDRQCRSLNSPSLIENAHNLRLHPPNIAELILTLSPEHQAQGVGFSLLPSTTLSFAPYWLVNVLKTQSPLEQLNLDSVYMHPSFAIKPAVNQFSELIVDDSSVTETQFLAIMAGSWNTLRTLHMHSCIVEYGNSWESLLLKIGPKLSALQNFFFGHCYESNEKRDEMIEVRFKGYWYDEVPEECRAGLTLGFRGTAEFGKSTRMDAVRYEGPHAGLVLSSLSKFAKPCEFMGGFRPLSNR